MKESTTTIGGNFKTDLENGPKNHGSRKLGNWQSDNAWDIFAPPNTVVNSYTNGTVTKIRDTGKNSGKIFTNKMGTDYKDESNNDKTDYDETVITKGSEGNYKEVNNWLEPLLSTIRFK